jgi:hypothetical protein
VTKEVLRTAKLDYIGLVDANRHSLAWEYLGEILRQKKIYDTGVIVYKNRDGEVSKRGDGKKPSDALRHVCGVTKGYLVLDTQVLQRAR